MTQPYLGEIRLFGFYRIPANWQACDGTLLQISTNDARYAVIGTTYGGDGQTTFAVPDLRGRAPIHQGQGSGLTNRPIGQSFGFEQVTLLTQNLPVHNHAMIASQAAATTPSPVT